MLAPAPSLSFVPDSILCCFFWFEFWSSTDVEDLPCGCETIKQIKKVLFLSEFIPGLEADGAVHTERIHSCCWTSHISELSECYLLELKSQTNLATLFSWAKTVWALERSELCPWVINHVCKVNEEKAQTRWKPLWETYLSWNHIVRHIPDPESKFRSVGHSHTFDLGSNWADHRVHFLVALFPYKNPPGR